MLQNLLRIKSWQLFMIMFLVPALTTFLINFVNDRFDIFPNLTYSILFILLGIDYMLIFLCIFFLPLLILYAVVFRVNNILSEEIRINTSKFYFNRIIPVIFFLPAVIIALFLNLVLIVLTGGQSLLYDILNSDIFILVFLLYIISMILINYTANKVIRAILGKGNSNDLIITVLSFLPVIGIYMILGKINQIANNLETRS